jgi:D-proline reductase (dithiol) PrdB
MIQESVSESFSDFKNSFSYGSRSDLSFKFLKGLSDKEATQFLQDLLWQLTEAIDNGDVGGLAALTLAYQSQAYAGVSSWEYDDGPFVQPSKLVSEMRLTLITSSGHFVDGKDPEPFGVKDMTQGEAASRISDFLKAEPSLSAIPFDTPEENLRVRHGGYDIRSAQADPNVTFPISRMKELLTDGLLGGLTENAYSFVGACAQTRLLRRTGPRWVAEWLKEGIEGAILVPV